VAPVLAFGEFTEGVYNFVAFPIGEPGSGRGEGVLIRRRRMPRHSERSLAKKWRCLRLAEKLTLQVTHLPSSLPVATLVGLRRRALL
jgi:hypothetical protein